MVRKCEIALLYCCVSDQVNEEVQASSIQDKNEIRFKLYQVLLLPLWIHSGERLENKLSFLLAPILNTPYTPAAATF